MFKNVLENILSGNIKDNKVKKNMQNQSMILKKKLNN